MSDSPPEKDVQWSEEGIVASYKFIQKLWNLNLKVVEEINKNHSKDNSLELTKFTNKFIKKITVNLESFSYNIIIANLHEMYSFLIREISKGFKKETILENYRKFLITINPIIPHFSNECLEKLNHPIKNITWPPIDKKYLEEEIFQIVTQINGKKRKVFSINKSIDKETIINKIKNDDQIKKYLDNKKIIKTIYIENKLINFIIQ